MAMDGPAAASVNDTRSSLARLYGSRTMLVLLVIGFSGGLPNVIATKVVQAWTAEAGWSVQAIGALSFLTLPYALKFIWAPLLDGVRLPLLGAMGRRRSWMLLAQVAVFAALVVMAIWKPAAMEASPGIPLGAGDLAAANAHNLVFYALLGAVVLCSATQDIASDAYRADILEPSELGAGASIFVTGYRMAAVLLGAGILLFADQIGWTTALIAAAALMALGIGATLAGREPPLPRGVRPGLRAAIVEPLAVFWKGWRWGVLPLAGFVLLFKLPDQLANAITTPLLMKGLGYSAHSIGWVQQVFGFAMTIVGAGIGGWMVARLGLVRCLWIFGVMHCVSICGFLLLALQYGATVGATPAVPPPVFALMPAIAIESLVIGMVTSGFIAFLMSVCDRRYTATQYALLTGLMAASGAIAGGLSGTLAARLDYQWFLVVAMCTGIPGLALIPFLRPPATPAGAGTSG